MNIHDSTVASQGLIEPAIAVFRQNLPEILRCWKQQIIDCMLMPALDSPVLETQCQELLAAYLESLTGSNSKLCAIVYEMVKSDLQATPTHLLSALLLLNNTLLTRLLADSVVPDSAARSFDICSSRVLTGIVPLFGDSRQKQLEWLVTGVEEGTAKTESEPQSYGDVTVLNTERVILDSVGQDVLQEVVGDYLDLLGTSAAIYEKGGDYATGIFSSSWCRFMDQSSRNLCGGDNKEALNDGQWHCHESCWNTSKTAMESGKATDLECKGGIRIYAVPIHSGDKVIGAINFGYGDPPKDEAKLQQLADLYQVPIAQLKEKAAQYNSRPQFIIDLAKRRLHSAAKLTGEMVSRREAQTELEALSRALVASNENLQQFAYVAAHDLKEPLRTINSYLDLLKRRLPDQLDEKATQYMNHIQDATKRMQSLITDLAAYSKVGSSETVPTDTDTTEVLQSTIASLDTQINECGASITYDALPKVCIDPSGLAQIFQNLLSNAIKFRAAKAPCIHVSATQIDRQWQFSVRDNGIGMEPQYTHQIFQLFRRLHSRDEYPGTGIGLAICKKLVEHNRGRMWVESELGIGSTFFFTVPSTGKVTR